tara:strand:- start:64 stop:453 length:390 start_codon:yes stop_codon:yes gene_type:complete
MEDTTAGKMVAAYIKLRSAIQEKEDEIKALKEKQSLITNHMLELCSKEEIDSIKTPFGTISRRLHATYWTNDWERMYAFIAEHDAYQLLEKRIHNTNMREFLEENPDVLPAGLQANRTYIVSVRKPTVK